MNYPIQGRSRGEILRVLVGGGKVASLRLLIELARLAGFEPAPHGLEVKARELSNLLKLLEAIEITELPFGLSFQILTGFCPFWNHFPTQIHTQ